MAILQGFPPSNTISPGVRITEKDLSFIAPEQTFHRAGLVGFASKGPINIPTLINTSRQLHTIFGQPHPDVGDPYLIYAAEQYLLTGSELFVVRVGDTDAVSDEAAEVAEVDALAAGKQVIIIGNTTPWPVTTTKDLFFKWSLNGVLSSKTLVLLADTYSSCSDMVDSLNDQLDVIQDGIEFFCTSDPFLGIRSTFAYGPESSIELISVQDSIYGPASVDRVFGIGDGMTEAESVGLQVDYPAGGGIWDLSGLTAPLTFNVVTDGTDNVNIDNIVQPIEIAPANYGVVANVVTAINAVIAGLPGGIEAYDAGANQLGFRTLHFGRTARLLIKSDSTLFNIFGFTGATATGDSPARVTDDPDTYLAGVVNGAENLTNEISLTFLADSAGLDGNLTQIVVTNDIRESVFTVEVYSNGVQVEAWGQLTKNQLSRFYVETFLSLVSDYVRVTDNTAVAAPPADGTYQLSGGSDGIPSDPDAQDTLLIGNDVNLVGIYALSDPEQIEIDLLAVPGHPSTSVVLGLLDVCQSYRQDCLAIVDPPFGLGVNEIVQWQNGVHPLNTTRFDSDFGALFWPWVKINDSFNAVDVWVPPSGSIMATIARSDSLSAPWFAPAGETRGQVPGILDVFSRPTLVERDLMYGNRNAVNPIIQFVDLEGFVLWGQKTLQRRPTALDRINVRRMMFVIEKRIRTASRSLLFDPHDEVFRRKFIAIASAILDEVKLGRGLTEYIIQADEELNTPDVIDRNEFRARIGVQPTRAVEFIFIEFSIHRTGDFSTTSEF